MIFGKRTLTFSKRRQKDWCRNNIYFFTNKERKKPPTINMNTSQPQDSLRKKLKKLKKRKLRRSPLPTHVWENASWQQYSFLCGACMSESGLPSKKYICMSLWLMRCVSRCAIIDFFRTSDSNGLITHDASQGSAAGNRLCQDL